MTKRWLAVLGAIAVVTAACGRDDDVADEATSTTVAAETSFVDTSDCIETPGGEIEGDVIRIGTVRPASGPYAILDSVASGLEAFVNATNAAGGVTAGDGKVYRLELVKEDDGYDPARTPGLVKKLVEQDGVFAMVGQIGTANTLAVRDYLDARCVPSVAATGSSEWGRVDEYPWFVAALASYATESVGFLEWLAEEQPGASIAVLYQDDDFGKGYLEALERHAPDLGLSVAASAPFNPLLEASPESKVVDLAASGADAFVVAMSGSPCPAALRSVPGGWQPLTYVSINCSQNMTLGLAQGRDEGIYTSQALYDPVADRDEPTVAAFRTDAAAAGLPEPLIDGGLAAAGWQFGEIFKRGVERAEQVDRAGVMNALLSLDAESIGLFLDGVTGSTDGPDDPWIVEDLRIAQRREGRWVGVSEVRGHDGRSNSYAG